MCARPPAAIITSPVGSSQQLQAASRCILPSTTPEVFTPAQLTAVHSNPPSLLYDWIWQQWWPDRIHVQRLKF